MPESPLKKDRFRQKTPESPSKRGDSGKKRRNLPQKEEIPAKNAEISLKKRRFRRFLPESILF
jgi:hypothetical protein